MRAYFSTLIVATLVLGAAPVRAQSLADVARREAERRKTVKDEGKVLTNRDVPEVHRSTPVPEVPVEPSDADKADQPNPADAAHHDADAADDAKTGSAAEPKDGQKNEKYWRDRQTALHVQLERDQSYAEALQSRINALTTDFVNRDDPAQQAVIATDRQKALAELSRVTAATETDKQAIADFEEEARRAAVPPGWLR